METRKNKYIICKDNNIKRKWKQVVMKKNKIIHHTNVNCCKEVKQSNKSASSSTRTNKPTSSNFFTLKFSENDKKRSLNKADTPHYRCQESSVSSSIRNEKHLPQINKKTQTVEDIQNDQSDEEYNLLSQPGPSRPRVNLITLDDHSSDGCRETSLNSSTRNATTVPKVNKKTQTMEDYAQPDHACFLLGQPPQATYANNALTLVWMEKFNQLPPIQRLHAEKAINDILFEAKLDYLQHSHH